MLIPVELLMPVAGWLIDAPGAIAGAPVDGAIVDGALGAGAAALPIAGPVAGGVVVVVWARAGAAPARREPARTTAERREVMVMESSR